MALLLLYWFMILIGYFIGSRCRSIKEKLSWAGRLLFIAIAALIFCMGVRMGASKEVIENLGTIGLEALFMTVCVMAGSILAVMGVRKLLKMDRFGRPIGAKSLTGSSVSVETAVSSTTKPEDTSEAKKGGGGSMSVLILVIILAGMLSGHFLVPRLFNDIAQFEALSGNFMVIGLCLLLFLVGIDLGLSGAVISSVKTAGMRAFAFPVAVVIGSLVAAFLCSFILPVSVKEALAIGAGFGWYTLAPIVISEEGYVLAGAISFLHNVMREFGGIILLPLVAEKIGYIEAAGIPGVASMDVCMPLVERVCGEHIVIYSFLIGLLQSSLVPFLVPLIIGM